MECHPVADLFPPMSSDEFTSLCADIAKRGQLVPIWTYQGQIIDGRHRWRACTLLGKAPTFQEWDGNGSLVEFVVSLNLHRRQLDTSQRGMLATKIAEALKEEGERRQVEGGKRAGRGRPEKVVADLPQANEEPEPVCEAEPDEEWKARNEAARIANVSPRMVQDAIKIRKERPDLADAVTRGEKTVHAAIQEIKGPKPPRTAPPRPKSTPPDGWEWVCLPDDPVKAIEYLRVHYGKRWTVFTAAVETSINAA